MENNTAKQHAQSGFFSSPKTETAAQSAPTKSETGTLKTIFGEFTSKNFWIELAIRLVREFTFAVFHGFANGLKWYADTKISSKLPSNQQPQQTPTPAASPAAQAFSRGYSPSSYQPVQSYPASPSHNDPSWPGWAPNR